MEKAEANKEKYEYFPFVQGEILEKHRNQLGEVLKKDLQSYLNNRASP
jgi:hypothetical protein